MVPNAPGAAEGQTFVDESLKAFGQSWAAVILSAKEAAEMNLCKYMTGLALDVEAYRAAMDIMEEEQLITA